MRVVAPANARALPAQKQAVAKALSSPIKAVSQRILLGELLESYLTIYEANCFLSMDNMIAQTTHVIAQIAQI